MPGICKSWKIRIGTSRARERPKLEVGDRPRYAPSNGAIPGLPTEMNDYDTQIQGRASPDAKRSGSPPLLTAADSVLLVGMLVIAVFLFYWIPKWVGAGGTDVEVRSGEAVAGRYSLDRDRTVEVTGPLGKTVLRIEGGKARIVGAPCPHKTCMNSGAVGRQGGIIVCVPNRVVVTVGRGVPDDLDAVTQ